MKYRKKPVVVEAIQFDGTPGGAADLFDVFDIPGAKFQPELGNLSAGVLALPERNAGPTAIVHRGDYVVAAGSQFYVYSAEQFLEAYEPVEES